MLATMGAFLLAAAALQPQANDVACIVDRIPAAGRTTVFTEATEGRAAEAFAPMAEAAGACMRERSWSEDFGAATAQMALANVVAEEAANHLGRVGIAAGWIDGWFEAQTTEIRTTEPNEATMAGVMYHLSTRGVSRATLEVSGRDIGAYVGARVVLERVAAGLP